MKRFISLFLALTLLLSVCVTSYASETDFEDVTKEHGNYKAISTLKEMGIIDGNGKFFRPDEKVSRAEFAKIVSKAADFSNATVTQNIFYDVLPSDWFYVYVNDVVNNGLMKGLSDNEFGINDNITKQEVLVVMYRFLNMKGIEIAEDKTVNLPLDEDLAEYAFQAVKGLKTAGIISYDEELKIYPNDKLTRASTCQYLYKILNYIGQKNNPKPWHVWDSKQPEVAPNDKIFQNIPVLFDPDKLEKTDVIFEDFNDDDYGNIAKPGLSQFAEITEQKAYSGKKSVKISKQTTGTQEFVKITYMLPEGSEGDMYVFSFMARAEDGSTQSVKGAIEPYSDVYMTGGSYFSEKVSDWTKLSTQFEVPKGAKKVVFQAYLDTAQTGTIYIDDMTLSKALLLPMETVLLKPAYKGLIYGDGETDDINVDVVINDYNGGYDLSSMKLCTRIIDENDVVKQEKTTDLCTNKLGVSFSSNKLEEGDYYLETILTDKESGKQIQRQSRTIRKRPADYRPNFYLDEHGRTIQDGKPFFYHSFYEEDGFEDTVEFDEDSNFNVISQYSYNWWINYNDDLYYKNVMLKKLKEQNKKLHVSIGNQVYHAGYTSSTMLSAKCEKIEDVRYIIEGISEYFKEEPSLFGYYMFDEKNPVTLGEPYRYNNEILANYDIDRPTWATTDRLYSYGVFTKMVDIIGVDPYPIFGREDDDVAETGRFVRNMVENFPNRPVYAAIQAFDHGKLPTPNSKAMREPNEQEMRNMVWQAICEGAQGIVYFSANTVRREHGDKWKEFWAKVNGIEGEIKKCENIIMSVDEKPYYEIKGQTGQFNSMSRHYEDKSYVFVVNNTNQQQTANLFLDENVKKITGLYSGKTYEVNSKGYFKIDFDKVGVEVFEYQQDNNYKASGAKIESFNLILPDGTSAITNYVGDDEPMYFLPSDVSKVKYSANISNGASLYINGIKSELNGEIEVKDQSIFTVKVVSENNKFITDKTYTIRIEGKKS